MVEILPFSLEITQGWVLNKAKHTLLTIKMNDEAITYTTVRFGKSSELQTRGRKDESQEPRGTFHRGKCFKHLNSLGFYAL